MSPSTQGEAPTLIPRPAILMLCAAGTLQPPVVTPSEEAILFRVEAVQDSQTLVDGDVAGIRREFRLLAEDIMEEVEVVADEEQKQWSSQELEEKTVEEQGQDRPGGPSEHQALDVLKALAALQVELSSECEQNHRAYHQRRKHHLAWGVPSSRASLASGPKLYPFRCSFGSTAHEEEEKGQEQEEGEGVRAQEGRWRPLKKMWSWAIGKLQRPSRVGSGQGYRCTCCSHAFECLLQACI